MIKIRLIQATMTALIEALHHAYATGNLRAVKRISALLDVAKDESIENVAKKYVVVRQTVHRWVTEFLLEGLDSLTYEKPSGRKPRLTKTQKARLKEVVKAGPQAAGFQTACWTSLLIQMVIYREFKVLYSRHYVCELLHNLGFSFQKARFVSDHLDEKRRQEWMEKDWPKILRQAKKMRAYLLFEDEASFPQWGSLGYTWAPKGQQPLVKTTGKRKAYKVFGLIDFFTGRLFYQGINGKFNSETYQAFLLKVLAETTRHLVIIQDGAKYHTSKAMRQFFAAHQDRITVYQLPSYSPDYNPIEYLWKNVKREATHNQYFPEFELLTLSVDQALAYYASHPGEVKNLMGVYCQSMAAGLPLAA
jgi:transposase